MGVGLIIIFSFLESWISYSVIIFTIAKFFQGIPAGGELPGAICYLAEASKAHPQQQNQDKPTWTYRRYMCSYALMGPQIGLAFSSLVCLTLKYFLSADDLLSHTWRYVFLISGMAGIGGFIMRKKLHETADFLRFKMHHKTSYTPLKVIAEKYIPRVIFGVMISIFEVVSSSIITVMPLYYYQKPFKMESKSIISINIIFTLIFILLIPTAGKISSKYYKFPWLKLSSWGVIFLSFFLYKSLFLDNFMISIIINIAMIFLLSIQAAILPSVLAELFPVSVRYTGIAFSFNICDGILWSMITSISILFISNNNSA